MMSKGFEWNMQHTNDCLLFIERIRLEKLYLSNQCSIGGYMCLFVEQYSRSLSSVCFDCLLLFFSN